MIAALATWFILQRKRRQVSAALALALVVIALSVAVPGAFDFLFGRAVSGLGTGGAGRTEIWAVGLSILLSAPLLGVGFGNFPLAFTPYAISQANVGSVVADTLYAGRGAHNVVLGASVETGILGATLLLAFGALAVWQRSGGREINVIRVALVSLFVQALFLDILFQKQLWLLLGLAFGLSAAERIRQSEPNHAASASRAVPQSLTQRVAPWLPAAAKDRAATR